MSTLTDRARAILARADREQRQLTAEEAAEFDALLDTAERSRPDRIEVDRVAKVIHGAALAEGGGVAGIAATINRQGGVPCHYGCRAPSVRHLYRLGSVGNARLDGDTLRVDITLQDGSYRTALLHTAETAPHKLGLACSFDGRDLVSVDVVDRHGPGPGLFGCTPYWLAGG